MNRLHLLTILAVFISDGCGGETGDRIEVSGTVTHDGEPLERGRIVFTPAEDTIGPSAGALIEGGQYRIPAEDGPHAGDYAIVVTVGGMPEKSSMFGSEPGVQVPQAQESQTFPFTRTIGDDGEQVLDFDLASRNSDSQE